MAYRSFHLYRRLCRLRLVNRDLVLMMRLLPLRDDALLLLPHNTTVFSSSNTTFLLTTSRRPCCSCLASVSVLLFVLLSTLLLLFLCYDLMLLTCKMQEGFSIRVGCSTKCTQYLFCSHHFSLANAQCDLYSSLAIDAPIDAAIDKLLASMQSIRLFVIACYLD